MDECGAILETIRRVAARTMQADFTVWYWGDAIAMDGLLAAWQLTGDEQAFSFVQDHMTTWVKERTTLEYRDHMTPGLALLTVYERKYDQRLLDGARRLADCLARLPRSPEGHFIHRPDLPVSRNSIWVDTMYHEPSFLCRLARITGDCGYDDLAGALIVTHIRGLQDRRWGLFHHSFDTFTARTNGVLWGRGNGWALLGLVDALEWLPRGHGDRVTILESLQQVVAGLAPLQDATGHWRTVLIDREAYLETSVAAFVCAGVTRAMRLGLVDAVYEPMAARAWAALRTQVDAAGSVFGVSMDTECSDNPDDYKRLPTETNPWGQGAFLRAAAARVEKG